MTRTAPAPAIGVAAYTIAVGESGREADLRLPLCRGGCWSRFFGDFELPADEALEVLAEAAEEWGTPPRRVELVGAPAACLLPALWLRTIWLGSEATILVRWETVERPGADGREALAAQLCAQIVDEIVCPDRGAAVGLWGIEPGPREAAGAAVFDALLGLIDSWDINLRGADHQYPVEWLVRARGAIEACADRGFKRIALYGAGTHTRALGPLLMQPRVEIACIIDDNASIQGTKLWGFPIVSLQEAAGMGLDAVVISANSIEEKLWANAKPLRDAGVPVIRLYGKEDGGEDVKVNGPRGRYGPRHVDLAPGEDLRSPREGAVLGVLALPPGAEEFWGACGRALRARGVGLYALAYHVDAPTVPLTGLTGSFTNAATLGQTWPQGAPLGPEPDAELLRRCVAYDRVFWRGAAGLEELTRRGARAAAWIAQHAIERLRPRAAVMWNGAPSFCLVVEAALRRAGVPVVVSERGAINPTVILDRIGWGRSEMTEDPSWIERMRRPATPAEMETGRRIARRLLEARAENWGRVRAAEMPARGGSKHQRTVAFFPTIEAGAEALSEAELAAEGMPLGDSPRACAHLLRAAAAVGARVVIKLHPNEPDRQRYQRLAAERGGDWTEITDAVGIHDAIEQGWVIATTSASVGWIALAAGAPLVSMNRRGYSACSAVFQAETPAELERALRAALEATDQRERHEVGLAALARYATTYCYSHASELVEAGVQGPERAAEWLAARLAAPTGVSEPRAWLAELAQAAGVPMPAVAV